MRESVDEWWLARTRLRRVQTRPKRVTFLLSLKQIPATSNGLRSMHAALSSTTHRVHLSAFLIANQRLFRNIHTRP